MADNCQPHRGPAIFLFFMNSSGSGIVAANNRTSVYERLLIWTGHEKGAEIDDATLRPEVSSSISPRPPGRLELNARRRGQSEVLEAGNPSGNK